MGKPCKSQCLSECTLNAWRLWSQQLCQPQWRQPEHIVAWLGGVQAQDYGGALWSIGLRLHGEGKVAQVEDAIAQRRIVRTWAFRGTLHFVAASDLHWLLSLLRPHVVRSNARRYGQLGLDEPTFEKSQAVMRHALEGGSQLSRAEIVTALEAEGISAQGQRAPYLLQRAALDGVICHGPLRGRESTYVLLAEWIEGWPGLHAGEEVTELARRYLAGHGPATAHDFAWWAGLHVSTARQAIASAPSVRQVAADGEPLWAVQDAQPPLPDRIWSELTAYLLPPFDGYLLGYKDRSPALDLAHKKRVNPGGGMPRPTIVVDGQVVGTWGRAQKGEWLVISQDLFRALDEDEAAAVEGAARRYAAFWSMAVASSDL